jgi:Tfp pilus assembly protein PilF
MQLALESRYINPHDAETTAKALHNLGTGFRSTAQPARAILAYEQALRIQPNRFKTLKDLAFAHWQLAAHLADRVDLQNWTDQTKLVTQLHRPLEAANEIGEQALQRRPADLYFQIGRAHQQYGRHDKALGAYRRALAQDRNYRRAHQGMAEIFAIQGEHNAATRALRSAADLTPPNAAITTVSTRYFPSSQTPFVVGLSLW